MCEVLRLRDEKIINEISKQKDEEAKKLLAEKDSLVSQLTEKDAEIESLKEQLRLAKAQ